MGFMTSRRTAAHFVSSNGVYVAKNCGQKSFRFQTDSKLQLFNYMARSTMIRVVPVSLQYALVTGMWATIVTIVEEVAAENNETAFTQTLLEPIRALIGNWTFLPTLLVVFKVNSHIQRWLGWLGSAASVSGRINDIALILGSLDGVNSPDVQEREAVRLIQYRFYRYLNLVHCLAYMGLDHRVGASPESLLDELEGMGLLETEEKRQLLKSADTGMHATVLSWLAISWHSQIEFQQALGDNHPNSTNFMQKLMDLRSAIACLRCENDFGDPEVTRGMMYIVTYILLFFVMIGLPLNPGLRIPDHCVQWKALVVSLSYIVMYHGLLVMQDILARSPFDPEGECVNSDFLLCCTEEVMFKVMRAAYAPDDLDPDPQGLRSIYCHPGVQRPLPVVLGTTTCSQSQAISGAAAVDKNYPRLLMSNATRPSSFDKVDPVPDTDTAGEVAETPDIVVQNGQEAQQIAPLSDLQPPGAAWSDTEVLGSCNDSFHDFSRP